MYTPSHFSAPDQQTLLSLIRDYPLATLIVVAADGPEINHVPLHYVADAGLGQLHGHVARANPLVRLLDTPQSVVAVFHGPSAYVSPGWYPAKAQDSRVVPTWNYAVAHVRGRLRRVEEPDWLRRHVHQLTQQQEAAFAPAWQVSDAPEDYLAGMLRAVVGVSLEISVLMGKFKLSQNQTALAQQGVVQGLRSSGASALADWMQTINARPPA